MKKKMIPMIIAASALVLPMLFSGCSLFGFTRDQDLLALSGHWVDVNGDTTLDFKGNQLTISYGDRYKEGFRVKVTKDSVQYVENASKEYYGSFGLISRLEIREDGRVLSAYEEVLDAEGHQYRFVREEDLEKEKEIIDKSKDLPKTIESDEITEFSLNFSLEDTAYDIPAGEPWYSGHYTFEVRKNDDGSYDMYFDGMGESYVICQYNETVSEEYVKGLAKLLQDQNVPAYNGWNKTNNEHFHSWSLYVTYESGEKLQLSAYGRPSLECPFSIYAFLQYADQQVQYTGEFKDDITVEEPETTESGTTESEPETEESKPDDAGDLEPFQGHWVDVNGDTTLDFEGNQMTVDLYGGYTEVYTVELAGSESYWEIRNAGEGYDRGFGIMGALHVDSDGALTAYEQVMDAEGHTFRFVREEDLAKEKEVRDLSEDMPKAIESEELTSFSLSFRLGESWYDVPEDNPFGGGRFSIEVDRDSDGAYRLDFSAMGESYVICQYEETVSDEFVQGLVKLIEDQDVAAHNGEWLENNEDFSGWSLFAEYESGEELQVIRYGRPALECPFSINAFLEYVNQEVGYTGWD